MKKLLFQVTNDTEYKTLNLIQDSQTIPLLSIAIEVLHSNSKLEEAWEALVAGAITAMELGLK